METANKPQYYFLSCGLPLIPLLIWNVLFASRLPQLFDPSVFWSNIPLPLSVAENLFRVLVFALPFLMPLSVRTASQRAGLWLYVVGVCVYFVSWLPLMFLPETAWSTSALGILAPAYTPAIWLFGIAMLGRRLYWGQQYRWWFYLVGAAAFLIAHVLHTALVYTRGV